jgi:hypothetical protein
MHSKPFIFKNSKGVEYSVTVENIPPKREALGECDAPWNNNPKIVIEADLTDRRRLSVAIEEIAHAFFFERPEKDIKKFAATLAKFLYKDDWRKTY